ncbi:hypothetical protein B0H11DRAFT_2193141, partial [Mycena galericulata]
MMRNSGLGLVDRKGPGHRWQPRLLDCYASMRPWCWAAEQRAHDAYGWLFPHNSHSSGGLLQSSCCDARGRSLYCVRFSGSVRWLVFFKASENWDDDFESHDDKTATRRSRAEDEDRQRHAHAHARHRNSHETTENWDNDFAKDDTDDAPSSSSAHGADSALNSHLNRKSPPNSSSSNPNPKRNPQGDINATASTSSGFSLPPPFSVTHRTPRAGIQQQRMRSGSGSTARQRWGDSSAGAEEEDRTVTARSRRTLTSYTRLSSSPPLPVPPLHAGTQTPGSSIGRGAGMRIGISIPELGMGGSAGLQPCPHSPTASVLSAPDSASIAYTHTSAGSTTVLMGLHARHVRQAVKQLGGLPPSPPVHRERRRLRKKSRPTAAGGGGGEITRRGTGLGGGLAQKSSEGEKTAEEDWDAEDCIGIGGGGASAIYWPRGGSTSSAAYNHHTSTSHYSTVHPMTRWGFGSSSISARSEGMGGPELDVIQDITAHANDFANTPRPPSANNSLLRTGSQSSSRSSSRHSYAHPTPTTLPPKNKPQSHSQHGSDKQKQYAPKMPPPTPPDAAVPRGWFFRGVSGSPVERERDRERSRVPDGSEGVRGEGPDVSAGERTYSPIPHGGRDKTERKGKEGKKLVKLGLVQIRRSTQPLNGNAEGDDNAAPTASPNAIRDAGGRATVNKSCRTAAQGEEQKRTAFYRWPPSNVSRATFLSLAHSIGFLLIPLTRAIFHGLVPALAVTLDLALAEAASVATVGVAGPIRGDDSLGDLRIPARISQAQVGLRRDLTMVREFARNVE